MGIVLVLAAAVVFEAVTTRAQQMYDRQETIETDRGGADTVAALALPEIIPEKPEVDSSKEIV